MKNSLIKLGNRNTSHLELNNPFEGFLNNTLRNFFNDELWAERTRESWKNEENRYVVEIELPRFTKDEIDVSVENGYVTITAESKDKTNFYQKSFNLGGSVNLEKIDGKLENGVLTIILPKTEQAKTRKVKID